MKVLGLGILEDAQRAYPYAKNSISRWKTVTEGADWKTPVDVKNHFNNVDPVGKCMVFNIMKNEFRLIAIVSYERSTVIVKAFLKHADYNRDRWKNECGC